MPFKPWNPLLLTALAVGATATAATAQTVAAGQKAIELERYNEARALLRKDTTPEANFELGRLYQMRQLPDSAYYYFNRAGGPTPAGQVAAGRALLAKGRAAEAEQQFDAAAKATKSKDAKVLTMIAQAYAESDVKDVTKPLAYVQAAETVNKTKLDPALLIARGDLYLKKDDGGGEAMTSYDRATAVDANNALAFYKKGKLNVRSRNGAEAKTNLEKAIAINPSYAPAYQELAEMYYIAGKYDLALSTFDQFRNMAEPSTNTMAEYASFLYLSKKYPESLVEVNKVLAVEPNNFTMNRLKAFDLYETGDYPGAAAAMQQFMKIAPPEKVLPEDQAYLNKILLRTGKGGEAIAGLQKTVQNAADPKDKNVALHDLYTAYNSQKAYPEAIKVLKQIMATPYGDLLDQFRLGDAFSANKQYPQSDSVFNIINVAKPTYGPAYLARARANVARDPDAKQGLAKPHYEKYIELSKVAGADPTKFQAGLVESYGYLGGYNYQKGDKAAALQNFEQVLVLDPGNKGAVNNIEVLKAKPRPAPARKPGAKPAAKKK